MAMLNNQMVITNALVETRQWFFLITKPSFWENAGGAKMIIQDHPLIELNKVSPFQRDTRPGQHTKNDGKIHHV
jgi:hypothetical protein